MPTGNQMFSPSQSSPGERGSASSLDTGSASPLEDKMFSQDHPHSQSQGQALIQGSWTLRSYPFPLKKARVGVQPRSHV